VLTGSRNGAGFGRCSRVIERPEPAAGAGCARIDAGASVEAEELPAPRFAAPPRAGRWGR